MDLYNDIYALYDYMKKEGFYVKNQISERKADAYIILGDGCSIKYVERSKDNVDGLLLLGKEDSIDIIRVSKELKKDILPNYKNKVRPVKVQISVIEFSRFIEILKKNSSNII